MERAGGEIKYPTFDQICDVNRRMIEQSGGIHIPPNNLRNRNSLEYILDAIKYEIFGDQLFLTLEEKAAALAYGIIRSHVFVDGNKRTALHIAWEFLASNGVEVDLHDESIINLVVRVAEGNSDREELTRWFETHKL
jgi:death-on-curing protein